MLLLGISFVAGVLTVLAPCVLPLLPVIIGGTISGGSSFSRAVRVIGALAVSVTVFTLVLKVSTLFIAVPPMVWKVLSGGLLIGFGLVTAFPSLWERLQFIASLNRTSNKIMSAGFMRNDAQGDFIVGAALGPVFTSCSPTYFVLLATVLPAQPLTGFVYLLSYVLGLCIALFAIAIIGQKIVDRLGASSDSHGWFKRGIGFLFVAVGVSVLSGVDVYLANSLPQSAYGITNVEQRLLDGANVFTSPATQNQDIAPTEGVGMCSGGTCTTTIEAKKLPRESSLNMFQTVQSEKEKKYKKAPELVSPDGYLNTADKPIHLSDYRGKNVVLLDIWTYSCINCQRTLPYIKTWYAKYKNQGLVVIGIHTPEFAFEHLKENVQKALASEGITYPVILDNQYQTWNAYGNHYWPRKYIVDIDGYLVYDHIGEGGYDETEMALQAALAERAMRLGSHFTDTGTTKVEAIAPSDVGSPEVYFGSDRNQYLANGSQMKEGEQTLTIPTAVDTNSLYLGGTWSFAPEYAQTSSEGAQITFKYNAKNAYMVLSSPDGAELEVEQDGQVVGSVAANDVKNSVVNVKNERLYKVIRNTEPGVHTLILKLRKGTLRAYTFTFG